MVCEGIHLFLHPARRWCIVKLSPHTSTTQIDTLYKLGFRQFHCCNTLPTEYGGLSGVALKPYTSGKIVYIRQHYPDAIIIAGGGVQQWSDVQHYVSLGANHCSISTLCFNPFQLARFWGKWH